MGKQKVQAKRLAEKIDKMSHEEYHKFEVSEYEKPNKGDNVFTECFKGNQDGYRDYVVKAIMKKMDQKREKLDRDGKKSA